jgi:hypothetical protein
MRYCTGFYLCFSCYFGNPEAKAVHVEHAKFMMLAPRRLEIDYSSDIECKYENLGAGPFSG